MTVLVSSSSVVVVELAELVEVIVSVVLDSVEEVVEFAEDDIALADDAEDDMVVCAALIDVLDVALDWATALFGHTL